MVALPKIIKSSAKKEWLGNVVLPEVIQLNQLLSTREIRHLLKISSAIQKRRGERGSPCRTPLEQLKKPTALPLTRRDNFAE
jgi:hypothetical protein